MSGSEQNKELYNFIKTAQAQGDSKEAIFLSLLKKGWKVDDVSDGFIALEYEKKAGTRKAELQKKTVQIIVIGGAMLIGAGIFSFIASNWEYMGKPMKIFLIFATMLVFYIAGWLLTERWRFPKLGAAFIFLGSIIYGAGIFLIGQMFNVRASWPDAFLIWLLGILPLAFILNSYLYFSLVLILGVVALVGHPIDMFGFSMAHRDPFLFTSTFLLIVTFSAFFYTAIKIRKQLPEEQKKYY